MTRALIYHDVLGPGQGPDEAGFPGPLAARYKLDVERFEHHLDAIGRTGVAVGPVRDDPSGPGCALTFDDGGASALLAAEALERRGWRGHFFITTGRLGTAGFIDAPAVRELHERGHGVGSHSHTHPTYMGRLEAERIAHEWRASREALADIVGEPPRTASVPGGFLSRAVIDEAARAGYRCLMTSEPVSRVSRHAGMAVLGRYTIWATTSPTQAAGYARGSVRARSRLWLEWNAKGLVKRIDPRLYQSLRRVRARRP